MHKWLIVQGDYEQRHRWLEMEEKAYRQTDIIVLVVDASF